MEGARMAKVLVAYYTQSGHTKAMAEVVADGAKSAGAQVAIREIEHLQAQDLLEFDGLIFGTPTYYGLMAAPIKELFDQSVQYHGQLAGKVAGAFASASNSGGGNETAILSMLQAFLVHGMIIPGAAAGDHYGPVAINAPDDRARKQCQALGRRVAELAIKLFG